SADGSIDRAYAQRVSEYYDRTAELYISTLGITCQAGLILGFDRDPYRSTNKYIARRADIRPSHRILDAGSGFCGPSIDICEEVDAAAIDAITISEKQARLGRAAVAAAGFSDRIRICVGDFHYLPARDELFDIVLMIESSGYSQDLLALYRELFR